MVRALLSLVCALACEGIGVPMASLTDAALDPSYALTGGGLRGARRTTADDGDSPRRHLLFAGLSMAACSVSPNLYQQWTYDYTNTDDKMFYSKAAVTRCLATETCTASTGASIGTHLCTGELTNMFYCSQVLQWDQWAYNSICKCTRSGVQPRSMPIMIRNMYAEVPYMCLTYQLTQVECDVTSTDQRWYFHQDDTLRIFHGGAQYCLTSS